MENKHLCIWLTALSRVDHLPSANWARMTMSEHICAICLAPLDDTRTSLECGHVFHTYCVETYCDSANQSISAIPCPQCKRTGHQLSELRARAIRDRVIPGAIPDPLIPEHDPEAEDFLRGTAHEIPSTQMVIQSEIPSAQPDSPLYPQGHADLDCLVPLSHRAVRRPYIPYILYIIVRIFRIFYSVYSRIFRLWFVSKEYSCFGYPVYSVYSIPYIPYIPSRIFRIFRIFNPVYSVFGFPYIPYIPSRIFRILHPVYSVYSVY